MDASKYATQELKNILNSPDRALNLFVKYMEKQEMVKARNESVH